MEKIYSEKFLEKKLREGIKNMGGLALKFSSSSQTGYPDRIILMPCGFCCWAECKTTGQKLRAEQEQRVKTLKRLGYKVFIVDDLNSLRHCIDSIFYVLTAKAYLEGKVNDL